MDAFTDRVCLLTGASGGIGAQLARNLGQRGTHLALVARSAAGLESLAEEITQAGGTARAFPCDLTDGVALATLVPAVEEALGPVDLLVNNAGIELFGHFADASALDIAQEIAVNLTAPLTLTRLVLPGMLARGRGQVVNLGSVAGMLGTPYGAVYSGTKAGLLTATHSLRQEHAGTGVGFSVVCPAFTHGAGMHEVHKEQAGKAPFLLGSCTVEEVVDAVVRAIRDDPAEVIVCTPPMRPSVALGRTFPGLSNTVMASLVNPYMKKIADARKELPAVDKG